MATVKAFRALRPNREVVGKVAALPYDVYSREEAREAVKDNPFSFLNIDRPETQFPPEQDMYSSEVYEKADALLKTRIADGTYVRDPEPCYYIYELTMDGRSQTGIAALSSIDDYLDNVCKKHENTVEEKEQDRIRHVDTCSCQTGPIFLAYRERKEITVIVEREKEKEALYDFISDDGIRHRVWKIDAPETVALLEKEFSAVPSTYIADGHHRAASAVKVGLKRREEHPGYTGKEEFNFFLSVLFPDNELKILDYNRVVKDLYGHEPEELMLSIEENFTVFNVKEAFVPKVKGEMLMYISGEWFLIRAKDQVVDERKGDPVRSLDVSILQDLVLSPLLGIKDPRTDKRIEFVGGIRGIKELERKVSQYTYSHVMDGTIEETGPAVAFVMHPTGIDELINVADHEMLMPPKSTWFEPKLRSGIFIHEFER
ncbi:DUF1015 domain-containing protein [Oribacterium sp. WCC10]|uniref:DUF1015 domain-containing protein n=1 Tax=Oribacterium sp. WCC10 TaxID=1855343 RepID=UPI0008EEEED0|nr:DUF1015 domain-containing protein [Oribacterium sp. WCC10]SFG19294.1 Uncharacterized conserved protein, DUF1015 family [Oribacterium sp. WCC10]